MPHPLLQQTSAEKHLLLGNEAIVRGALEAGVQVVTCYPGTPSSEVPDTFYRLSPDAEYAFEYSVNEKVALEVAGGATLAGAMTLCTMKHVGVNVAADPLMTLAYTGTPGGLVLLSADDPGCHSSQNEQDNRYYARLAGMACFEPATAQEAKDMARDALLLSRETASPILLRTTTRVNHLRGPVAFGPRKPYEKPSGFKRDVPRFVPIPAFARPMHERLLGRLEDLRAIAEKSPYNRVSGKGTFGIVASGISRAYVADALEECGLAGTVKVLDLGMSHPFPEKLLLSFMGGLDELLVVEELEPIVENDIRVLAQKHGLKPTILGKDVLPRNGEFTVSMVRDVILTRTGGELPEGGACLPDSGLPVRPPNLCAGCPHRGAYFAARQVFGDEAVYSSDIGCYTLGLLPPLGAADFLLCMGSSISAGTGVSRASGQRVVAFIGDSTFFHSGITGLVNAVFNRHDILFVILDNRTTAMTGHQPNPGVDRTILGDVPVSIDIEGVVRGVGVTEIRKVNPLNLKKTTAVFEELKAMSGVRVLICEEPCPLHARRVYKKKPGQVAYVTEDYDDAEQILERLACPAFQRCEGRFEINEHLCGGCMLCLQLSTNIKARKRESK